MAETIVPVTQDFKQLIKATLTEGTNPFLKECMDKYMPVTPSSNPLQDKDRPNEELNQDEMTEKNKKSQEQR